MGQPAGLTIQTARAFAVHVFTASGAAFGFIALILATGGHWAAMFFVLGLALLVDGLDGYLAREFQVAKLLPRWSGDTLDLVVDFTTYVFVPAYAIAASGLLPEQLSVAGGIIVVVTGAIYFADREMKTSENYFRGFPAVWNAAAFYLYLLRPPAWLAFAALIGLAVLTFVPIRFLHPLRVKRFRPLSVVLLLAWAVLALIAVATDLEPDPWVSGGLCLIAAYFLLIGGTPK